MATKIWQCRYCGKQYRTLFNQPPSPRTLYPCKATPTGNHVWERLE